MFITKQSLAQDGLGTPIEQRKRLLNMLTNGTLTLPDIPGALENLPSLKKNRITGVLKALPNSTPKRVEEIIWIFDLHRPTKKGGRVTAVALDAISAETYQSMFTMWEAGGVPTTPHSGWPFWPE